MKVSTIHSGVLVVMVVVVGARDELTVPCHLSINSDNLETKAGRYKKCYSLGIVIYRYIYRLYIGISQTIR